MKNSCTDKNDQKQEEFSHLFAYGTLRDEKVLKTITGQRFKRQPAILKGYKRCAPKSAYPYILPHEQEYVKGWLIQDIPSQVWEKFDEYEKEGLYFLRQKVEVITENNCTVEAYTYVGNPEYLRRTFGDKIEYSIHKRVFEYIQERIGDEVYRFYSDKNEAEKKRFYQQRLIREIFGPEINHLTSLYCSEQYLSKYVIKSELDILGIPSLKKPRQNREIRPYIKNYLNLIVKHSIVNQLEIFIRNSHIHYLFNPAPYWQFTLTMLAALRLYNNHQKQIQTLINENFELDDYNRLEYTDYLEKSIILADLIYKNFHDEVRYIAMEIYDLKRRGYLSLGVELEFSNLGSRAIQCSEPHEDSRYANMKYFHDFDLFRRTWKFGGHIDDHSLDYQANRNKGGFLEYAFGKKCFFEKYSEPITNDPRILHYLVIETLKFSDIQPHSLHLNIQKQYDIDWKKENNIDYLICLLMLGGDILYKNDSGYHEKRVSAREIIDSHGNLQFILQNRHSPYAIPEEEEGTPVIEFQFPRLDENKNYELLTMVLKGFLMGYKPRPFYIREQVSQSSLSSHEAEVLMKWALKPYSLSEKTILQFLGYVEKGLLTERNNFPAHRKKYIIKTMYQLEKALFLRNSLLRLPSLDKQFKHENTQAHQ